MYFDTTGTRPALFLCLSHTHTHSYSHTHTQNRVSDAVEVMKSVRFPNMSREYLLHIVETEDLIKEDPQCLQMVGHLATLQNSLRSRRAPLL